MKCAVIVKQNSKKIITLCALSKVTSHLMSTSDATSDRKLLDLEHPFVSDNIFNLLRNSNTLSLHAGILHFCSTRRLLLKLVL